MIHVGMLDIEILFSVQVLREGRVSLARSIVSYCDKNLIVILTVM